jgi:peroxiredoxin
LTTDLRLHTDEKITDKIDIANVIVQKGRFLKVTMVHPNRSGQVTWNGSTALFYAPKWRTYVIRDFKSAAELLTDQDFRYITDGALRDTLMEVMLMDEPYKSLMKERTVKSYNGIDLIGKERCHHLTITRTGAPCVEQIWISCGREPWIRKFVPEEDCPLTTLPIVESAPKTVMSKYVRYEHIKSNPHLQIGNLKPPGGAIKATRLVASSVDDARQTMVGKKAPQFAAGTTYGAKFRLAKQHHKIVVMEFWATWCAPCCRALPVLNELTRSFAKRAVQFIAVNEKENESTIKSFLAASSLDVPVAFDVNGDIARLYHVVGIPQTVVIDRDGRIRSIHVGFSSKMKEEISDELNECLRQ